jgi:2-amino-4-hydroxy-6-hydroxymethyldihydropteridine diphosphokinase
MPRAFVAAGSNVEPERHLARAAQLLDEEFGAVRCSPWYRNRAVGFEGQDFINFVVGFDTELPVTEVVRRLRAIETACGRPRDAPKWAPRTIDLDILLYGDLVSAGSPTLPRPDLLRRAYMLGPLADIAPEVVHPTAAVTIGQLWSRFDRAAHPLEPVPAAFTSPRSVPHRSPGSGR